MVVVVVRKLVVMKAVGVATHRRTRTKNQGGSVFCHWLTIQVDCLPSSESEFKILLLNQKSKSIQGSFIELRRTRVSSEGRKYVLYSLLWTAGGKVAYQCHKLFRWLQIALLNLQQCNVKCKFFFNIGHKMHCDSYILGYITIDAR